MKKVKREKKTFDPVVKEKKFKRSNMRGLKFTILGSFVLIILVGVMAILMSIAATNRSERVSKELVAVQKMVNIKKEEVATLTPAVTDFVNKFVKTYINVPRTDGDFKAREKDLETYFASGLKQGDMLDPNSTRTLKSAEIVDFKSVADVDTAFVKVTYDLTTYSQVEREVMEGKKKVKKTVEQSNVSTASNVLAVPIKQSGKTMAVVADPYFTDYEQPTSKKKVNSLGTKLTEDKLVNTATDKQIHNFLDIFFAKYTSASDTDMQFLMSDPETVQLDLVGYTAKNYKSGKDFISKVDVQFTEQNSKIVRNEQMTLYLSKKDSTYFIDKLVHNLGDGK